MKKPPMPFAKIGDVLLCKLEKRISNRFKHNWELRFYWCQCIVRDCYFDESLEIFYDVDGHDSWVETNTILYNLTTQKENPNFNS